jgi:hypothetical protein
MKLASNAVKWPSLKGRGTAARASSAPLFLVMPVVYAESTKFAVSARPAKVRGLRSAAAAISGESLTCSSTAVNASR